MERKCGTLKCLRCGICKKPIKNGFICKKCSGEKNDFIDDDENGWWPEGITPPMGRSR